MREKAGVAQVLLVEDDEDIRDIVQDVLEDAGYDVVPASHGRQALEFLAEVKASASPPDLVILDLMMPLVDGHQVLFVMGGDRLLASIPVVVISAFAREKPDGAAAFLRKPFSLDALSSTVHDLIVPGLGPIRSTG
jgi:CheY-like chemotaxis protein